ncbi:T9SS type A sorting domain-containing protein [Ichthyenterobacterium sp. W332]|uniref:T9SS type A sorting domain-containing protein n=1 Tax=Microcosmobacter mediterraneus TaxID=3075607 RepID=A0ABU2YHL5_9FLAO|nr:T9SS type A sorting domain-containing protein [Ichthyenterobacterium sp. W332]MDT0557660.1 T9SS type A sorting domain-containing protein [Ichthyenterobacterium sp. W332]
MNKLKFLLFNVVFFFILTGNSQVIAYDATFSEYAISTCIDLTSLNPVVKGHQLNYVVSYHKLLSEAQTNSNVLPPFYSYQSLSETLYARVTNNNDSSDYATSEITINLSPLPCCPPPPPGYNSFNYCDTDNDGLIEVYLPNLRYIVAYGYPPESFCDIDVSEINIQYFASQEDLDNGSNPLDEIYNITENTEIYYLMTNTVSSDSFQAQFGINIETCNGLDTDGDGINDYDEDVNRNGYFEDDDTDMDGLKNFEDDDDDNDLILTIDEDYNSNGSALDDDINGNGIADYLESNATLSNQLFDVTVIDIYPNPILDKLNINNTVSDLDIEIFLIDINGKIIFSSKLLPNISTIDMTSYKSGIYFLKLKTAMKTSIEKVIKL